MLRTVIPISLFLLFAVRSQLANEPDWRQIVPGQTTRTQVEQLLGRSSDSYSASYDLKDGNLWIAYSTGPCGIEKKGGWNLAKDTVVEVTFTPKKKRSISALKLNMRNFRKVANKHTQGVTYYINEREGITYEVQRGKVDSVTYEPQMNLYCGDSDLLRDRIRPL